MESEDKLEGKKKVRMRKLRENCEKGHVFMVWGLYCPKFRESKKMRDKYTAPSFGKAKK